MGHLRISVVSLLCMAFACNGNSAYTTVAATDPLIRYTGRFDIRVPTARRMAWPGTHISARFTGSIVRVVLTDTPFEDETRETDWVTVVIDDRRPRNYALAEGQHVYPLADDLDASEHRVTIWKRTEGEVGTITFDGFQLERDHHLTPTPKTAVPARSVEVIGDSISAGYGNEGTNSACHWSARTQNNYLTYGAYAARALNAAFTCIAWSGKGVTRNYDAFKAETMPALIELNIPTDPAAGTTTAPPPDVFVINLGTNDWFASTPDHHLFVTQYTQMLIALRQRAPKAWLVLALGPMLADDYPQPHARTLSRQWLQEIQMVWRRTHDERIDFIELWTDPNDGNGCDFHPNIKTHERLGRELAAFLRARLGW